MLEWLWTHAIGWWGLTGIIVAIAIAVFIFVPGLKREAILTAVFAVLASFLYTRGWRDKAKEEAERREKVVKKAKEKFDEIDARPDSDRDVDKRLRDGNF